MKGRIDIGRVLIALALIVQIFAPVASNTSMVRATLDPVAEALLCHDDGTSPGDEGSLPVADHHRHACDFCQLATAGGYAPPPAAAVLLLPSTVAGLIDWRVTVEAVVGPRLLDHIRGRAPPILA